MKRAAQANPSCSVVLFSLTLIVFHLCLGGYLEGAEGIDGKGRVYDALAVASFLPPQGWVRWNFWGITTFSPTTDHEPRLTFAVNDVVSQDRPNIETVMKDYVRTFSTENYTLITQEYLYMGGYPGVRLLAQGTEKNRLFNRDYIWIQEYRTAHHKIILIFRSEEGSFETYRKAVLESFRSLVITGPAPDE